jgi:hypothetical protein
VEERYPLGDRRLIVYLCGVLARGGRRQQQSKALEDLAERAAVEKYQHDLGEA